MFGRTGKGTQCTRKAKNGSVFCGSHMKSLPHGRVDEEKEEKLPERKKRGRPKKTVEKTPEKVVNPVKETVNMSVIGKTKEDEKDDEHLLHEIAGDLGINLAKASTINELDEDDENDFEPVEV